MFELIGEYLEDSVEKIEELEKINSIKDNEDGSVTVSYLFRSINGNHLEDTKTIKLIDIMAFVYSCINKDK